MFRKSRRRACCPAPTSRGSFGRAWRKSLPRGSTSITPEALAEVVSQFPAVHAGAREELQETAAMIECTDREFLPKPIVERMEKLAGAVRLQERLTALKQSSRRCDPTGHPDARRCAGRTKQPAE